MIAAGGEKKLFFSSLDIFRQHFPALLRAAWSNGYVLITDHSSLGLVRTSAPTGGEIVDYSYILPICKHHCCRSHVIQFKRNTGT